MCLLARGLSLDRGTNGQRRLHMLILGRRKGVVGRRWSLMLATVDNAACCLLCGGELPDVREKEGRGRA